MPGVTGRTFVLESVYRHPQSKWGSAIKGQDCFTSDDDDFLAVLPNDDFITGEGAGRIHRIRLLMGDSLPGVL